MFFALCFTFLQGYGQYYYHYYPRPYYFTRPSSISRSHTHQKIKYKQKGPKKQTITNDNRVFITINKEQPKQVEFAEHNDVCVDEYQECTDTSYRNTQGQQCVTEMWRETVWFPVGSYTTSLSHQQVTLQNVADYLTAHCDVKIRIVGYASSSKGSYDFNKRLAENRVRAVKWYLNEKFGIAEDRIFLFVEGTDSKAYLQKDEWNQCVTIDALF